MLIKPFLLFYQLIRPKAVCIKLVSNFFFLDLDQSGYVGHVVGYF